MMISGSGLRQTRDLALRLARLIALAGIALFVIRVAVAAVNQTFVHDDFSESLSIKLEALPFIFPLHMLTGGLALILVPLAWLLRGRGRWHRAMGFVSAVDVVLAGLSAYPVAWVAPVSPWSAAGFMTQATVWLVLLALGIRFMLQGRIRAHRACMLMMAAATSGAVFFRLYLALWAIFAHGRHFVLFYSCDAWLAWGIPLLVTAYVLRQEERLNAAGTGRTYSR